jgi:PAS domain S-box-containing protein
MANEKDGFLSAGGEMGERTRRHDWAGSTLGMPPSWPEALKSVVSLMLASRFPMFLLWGDRHICLYNDGYIPLLGKRHPTALGQPFQAIWPEIWSSIHPLIQRAYAGDSLYFESLPLRVERNQFQEEANFTFSYSPLRDADGRIMGAFCACMETTEQLRAESKLRDSEARWRGLFNNMQEGFCLAEPLRDSGGQIVDFRLLEMNPGFERQTGLRTADAIGRSMRELVHGLPDDVISTCAQVMVSGEACDFETHIADLGNRWFEVRARKAEADQLSILFLDITPRKTTEAALRQSEATFRGLTQAMPNQAWTAKPDGQLDWFNDRVYGYASLATSELIGAGWAHMVHPEDIASAAERWKLAVQTGAAYEAEFRLRRADGSFRWHIARAIPIRAIDGSVERWVGTNTDIEDQKNTEQELARLNDTLELRVTERTAELEVANEALRQSQKMEAVGQLTGGIAHDFNNLLTGVIGSLDMLHARIGQQRLDGTERYVDAAMTSARRAAALTHRLLAFSRRQPLKPEVLDVNALVRSMEDLLSRTLGPAIQFELIAGTDLWPTLCDPNQLENALLNLVINARDALPESGLLQVSTSNVTLDSADTARQAELEPGDYVCLAVKDNGSGMPQSVIERAFDPFFTTKPIGQGTGLGLSMIYGFAKQSRGHISIESVEGHGTTVRLYLPRSGRGSTPLMATENTPQSVATSAPGNRHVLVVEDEPVIREMVVEVLADHGYDVIQASDGLAALEIIASDVALDLLITDVGLPGINGRLLAEKARQQRPVLKILFITGYAEDAIFGQIPTEEGMEMLPKPFGVSDLLIHVNGLFHR